MDDMPEDVLRVAVLAGEHERGSFRNVLEGEGLEVVLDGALELPLPATWNGADVLLVAMEGEQVDRTKVQGVLQQSPVPVLLNHGGIGASEIWSRRLIDKLHTLARRALPHAWVDAVQDNRPELRVVRDSGTLPDNSSPWLVVLGGSIGGPRALAQFLEALPEQLPVVLLVAQHISESYQDLLAEQLDRCGSWPVALVGDEQTLEAGQVWMVPAESAVELDDQARVIRSGHAWDSIYQPDIDALLEQVAGAWAGRCGVILFSGLGEDGSRGCTTISGVGGFVWTQSAESCTISNLPDAAGRSCRVEFSGTPAQLARQLALRCQPAQPGIN
ncbi:chemosensory pili system protein ChpB (putative protein-glutamate methylesterase) [Thiogranum longum]|uniref:protein-glutamate methylesterase n=1 Tax=Thiogranum longum TaxID=1537524 RepID=A0A4R1H7H2_9GAMM|nr:chemotaxis protein CheB [Thiogranum longum]TCK17148.1 chemosensory pili system protein ChpB (putative protein-glutamate methylesterase) [Thiogranum longum]